MHILTKDKDFVKAYRKYFPKGASKEVVDNRYILVTLDSTDTVVYTVINIVTAGVISDISYEKIIEKVLMTLELTRGEVEELTFIVLLKHLSDSKQLIGFLDEKRDFITEAIARKLKIHPTNVTEEHKEKILNDPGDIYSITDEPVTNWDEYFFNICRQAARNSKCLSRRIGAVLVKDKSVISTGYNGPPRGVPTCQERWDPQVDPHFSEKYIDKIVKPLDSENPICPRYSLGAKSGQMLDICVAAHAEENSILDAARRGVCTKGSTMYMTCGIPCFRCLNKIINAGVSEIVVTGLKFYDDNSEFLLNHSDVKVRLYEF